MLPTLVYGPNSDRDWGKSDSMFLCGAAINQVITSLEVYYNSLFREITEHIMITDVNPSNLKKFLEKNGLISVFLKTMASHDSLIFPISEILTDTFSLQNKDKIKTAFNLIELNPFLSSEIEWERTFGDHKTTTVKLRHAFVHRGINFNSSLNTEIINNRISDAIVLVNCLEKQFSARAKTQTK